MYYDGSGQARINSLHGGGPYFTQDGRIVIHSKTNKSEICVADIDGINIIKLTDIKAKDWHPEVLPDGKKIAFISDRDGNLVIYMMNIDGSEQVRLTNNHDEDWNPSWSPEGTQIKYHTRMGDQEHVNIMNRDGSSVQRFIPNASRGAWLNMNALNRN